MHVDKILCELEGWPQKCMKCLNLHLEKKFPAALKYLKFIGFESNMIQGLAVHQHHTQVTIVKVHDKTVSDRHSVTLFCQL